MAPCKQCKNYTKKRIIKVKGSKVYRMKDQHNILYTFVDRPCSRCGLLVRDLPGVEVVND